MPFSLAKRAASKLICDEWPSNSNTIGRAGGIEGTECNFNIKQLRVPSNCCNVVLPARFD